jgi:hypothetical protein
MKKYVIMIDDQYEYDLYVDEKGNDKTYSLHYSQSDFWGQSRSKLALRMTDNGNGIKFNRSLRVMDYCDMGHVRLLLNFAKANTKNKAELESVINVYSVALNSVSAKPIEL